MASIVRSTRFDLTAVWFSTNMEPNKSSFLVYIIAAFNPKSNRVYIPTAVAPERTIPARALEHLCLNLNMNELRRSATFEPHGEEQ
jgi:hypothetical protein